MTDEFEQIPFSATEIAENPEPRCPCLLLLDTSGSMAGKSHGQAHGAPRPPRRQGLLGMFPLPKMHRNAAYLIIWPRGSCVPLRASYLCRSYCQQEGRARRAGSMRARSELQLQAIRNEASATTREGKGYGAPFIGRVWSVVCGGA
jgi:hypothetical protein